MIKCLYSFDTLGEFLDLISRLISKFIFINSEKIKSNAGNPSANTKHSQKQNQKLIRIKSCPKHPTYTLLYFILYILLFILALTAREKAQQLQLLGEGTYPVKTRLKTNSGSKSKIAKVASLPMSENAADFVRLQNKCKAL